jgi:multicomponent Na+:H+ antiporter subunit E
LLFIWLLIAGTNPSDLPTGIVAAVVAAWASLVLLPPSARRVRLAPLSWLGLRLLRQSVIAGADVARRALDPRLPLNPGFVRYRPALPGDMARSAFATLMSLVPGTLPVGSTQDGVLLVHCLDVSQPVGASLGRDDALLSRALGRMRADA